MKLITETVEEVKYLTEEKDGAKHHFIEGIFLQSELKNRNGRIYPKSVLEREVGRYVKEYVNEHRAVGELGHPDTPNINLDRVSHKIISLKEDGNNYIGKAQILDTPFGQTVQRLIEGGVKLGVSSRGMGSLKEIKEAKLVQDDFYLATAADIVADPSAPDAFVRGIMENREWVWENGIVKEADIAKIRNEILGASRKQLEEVTLRNFAKFLKAL